MRGAAFGRLRRVREWRRRGMGGLSDIRTVLKSICLKPGRSGLVSMLVAAAFFAPAVRAAGPTASGLQPSTEELLRTLMRQEAIALENGEGVPRDPERAATVYCEAARLGDAESQYNLGWMYTNGRGVERNDTTAAFFFNAAAEQGLEAAVRMLARVGGPPTYVPDCMQERVAPKETALAPPRQTPLANAPVRSAGPAHIVALVKKLAPEFQLHPQLVLSIIEAESNFDSIALSPRNAKGLMQLIPDTAARFNVRSPYDPAQNIRGGMAYLRWLLSYYEGDVTLVAAAYNAGEGAVNRYRGVPPYAETRAYVRKILALAGFTAHPFDAAVAGPSPQLGAIREARRRR